MKIDKNVENDGVIFMSIKENDEKASESVHDGDVTILAIESSCDETAAAVVVNGRDVRSNVISSQIDIHTLYGGVVPEIASRKHIEKINYVVQMGDRGRTSINEDREVFNLPPVEDGDRHFIRGEYRPVDSYEGTELDPLPDGSTEPVDKSGRGGIIEKRGWVTIKGQHVYIGEEGGTDASAKGKNKFVKGFRNKQALNNHWQNGRTHQKEYADDGITTKEQYEARALELAESACSDTILGYKNAQNEIVRYDTEKNDFVKGNPNKCIKTLFKPKYDEVKAGDKDAGLRYFKEEMKNEGEKSDG